MVTWTGIPVSLNKRAKIINGRFVLTEKYINFKKEIEYACHGEKTISGYADLYLKMWLKPDRDTDNYIKGICDGIKDAQVVYDDKYIRNIFIERFYIDSDTANFEFYLKKVDINSIPEEQRRIIIK